MQSSASSPRNVPVSQIIFGDDGANLLKKSSTGKRMFPNSNQSQIVLGMYPSTHLETTYSSDYKKKVAVVPEMEEEKEE